MTSSTEISPYGPLTIICVCTLLDKKTELKETHNWELEPKRFKDVNFFTTPVA